MHEALRLLFSAATALLVAALPEAWKTRDPYRDHATAAAHVVSAGVEVVLAVTVFLAGLIAYVEAFARGPGYLYVTSRPTLTHSDFFGVGVIAYLSYLLHPVALLALYCLGEAIIRALEAAVTGRLLGVAVVALPLRAAVASARLLRRVRLLRALGPPQDDEVVPPERTGDGGVWVYASREKAWSEVQVVEHAGRHFILAGKELVERGERAAFLYRFRPLDETTVIRGPVVRLLESQRGARRATPRSRYGMLGNAGGQSRDR